MNKNILRFFEIRSYLKHHEAEMFKRSDYINNPSITSSYEYVISTDKIYYLITVFVNNTKYTYKLTENLKEKDPDVFYLRDSLLNSDTKQIKFKSIIKSDFIIDYFYNFHSLSVSIRNKENTSVLFDGLKVNRFSEDEIPYEVKVFPQIEGPSDLKNKSICYEVPNHCVFSELYIESFEQL